MIIFTIKPLTPNDPYSGRTAPLTSKRCILYIYSTNICTEYFKHGINSPLFFSSKCSLFHNSNIFGSCFIHILYTGCVKIKKKIPAPNGWWNLLTTMLVVTKVFRFVIFIRIVLWIYVVSIIRRNGYWKKGIKTWLTLILLTWRIWWAPNNANKWQMGFIPELSTTQT